MNIDLSNKNILVTGASRGIGAGMTEALAASGARIAVHYQQAQTEAESLASGLANHATGTTIDVNAGSYMH